MKPPKDLKPQIPPHKPLKNVTPLFSLRHPHTLKSWVTLTVWPSKAQKRRAAGSDPRQRLVCDTSGTSTRHERLLPSTYVPFWAHRQSYVCD